MYGYTPEDMSAISDADECPIAACYDQHPTPKVIGSGKYARTYANMCRGKDHLAARVQTFKRGDDKEDIVNALRFEAAFADGVYTEVDQWSGPVNQMLRHVCTMFLQNREAEWKTLMGMYGEAIELLVAKSRRVEKTAAGDDYVYYIVNKDFHLNNVVYRMTGNRALGVGPKRHTMQLAYIDWDGDEDRVTSENDVYGLFAMRTNDTIKRYLKKHYEKRDVAELKKFRHFEVDGVPELAGLATDLEDFANRPGLFGVKATLDPVNKCAQTPNGTACTKINRLLAANQKPVSLSFDGAAGFNRFQQSVQREERRGNRNTALILHLEGIKQGARQLARDMKELREVRTTLDEWRDDSEKHARTIIDACDVLSANVDN